MGNNQELIQVHSGPFSKVQIRVIKNQINSLFNQNCGEENGSFTVGVHIQFNNGTSKCYWAEIPNLKPENIAYIGLYKIRQNPVVLPTSDGSMLN